MIKTNALVAAGLLFTATVAFADVHINEVDADQTSTDSAEFIELYDGGVGNTDLTGLVLVLMNGSDDASYLAFDLDGMSTNGQGYFVLCGDAANVPNCDLDVEPNTNLIQNGADAVALYTGDADDFPNDTPVTTTNLLDAIVYDTDDGDDAGLLVLLNADQPQVNERDGGSGTTHSNQRCPNGSGGARNTDTYAQATPTPGQDNNCVEVFGACCDDSTGECTDGVAEANCVGAGNRYGGDGVDCVDIDPPCEGPATGSCCDDSSGDCTDDVTQEDCEGAGNRYGGDGVDCVDIDPPCVAAPTGACCSAGFCGDDVTQVGCETGGGTYQGDGSQCPADCGDESAVTINEIRIDQPGSDVDEYFELAGAPGTSLDGMTYLVIGDSSGGGSGVIDFAVDLTGNSIGSSGFFVAAEDGSLPGGGTVDLVTFLGFENSDNVTHMLVAGFTGAPGDDLDTDDDCVLDSTPWAGVVDSIALLEEENPPSSTECHYGPPSVGPDGNFVPGHVYRCNSAGLWTIGAFSPDGGDDTPGAKNGDCVVEPVEINELRIDQPGSDVDEYFELTGEADASLDGLTYIVIGDNSDGDSGIIEAIIDLTGSSIGGSGFFVAAEDSDVPGGGTVDLIADINFENSDNVTHMVVFGFTGESGDDVDTDNDGVIDNPLWSSIVSCIALVETPDSGDLFYCDATVGPDGNFVPGQAYRCHPDGDWTIGAFSPDGGDDTPGGQNADCPAGCGDPEAGDCFEANGSPACDDEDCCNTVCESDPFCCDSEWNSFCADTALVECRECGDCDAGDCFEANGTPYCASGGCCSLVCDMNPACCEAETGWDEACAAMALANCATLPEPGDLAFGLSTSCPSQSIELVREGVPLEGLSGVQVPDFWVEAFMQSMEFDNLNGVGHNNQGNLLALNFGSTGGSVWSFATCSPVFGGTMIGNTVGLGGDGVTETRLGGLSVSPDNTKIAAGGFDSAEVVVYDYTAGDCNGNGASLSGARETSDGILCGDDTQGTAWLNNSTVLAFSTTGDIWAIDANSMDADLLTTVPTDPGCGPGFTDIEFNPDVSPYVYAMYSAFAGGTINTLFVLDPNDNFALLGVFDYSESMNTSREIAFDADGNLFVSMFSGSIDVIPDAANLGSLADNNSLDWYSSSDTSASFSGIDVAHGSTAVERTLIVKQGSCPARVNPNSNGVIPMLLVGDEDFDVNNVDLGSLELRRCDGAGGTATPLADHTHVVDLNHPFGGEVGCGECACNDDQSSDGIGDLSLKFRTSTTLEALGLSAGDGVVTVELTGSMVDGSTFVARDCVVIVPPGSGQSNATMQSNVSDTFIDVTPLDLNVDSDGFADFSRSYVSGTVVTVTAPTTSQGRRFLRWSVDNVLQPLGVRTMEISMGENTTLKAFYQRASRVMPGRPTAPSGDQE
ncbi:MAG: lamin tail domain-containing protein [Planctomycetes bacterium]|nr:lamin tail domain-containing protein [Planctomycetota bacterium]